MPRWKQLRSCGKFIEVYDALRAARREFRRLLSASDLRAPELLAETLATKAQLRARLDREGLTSATGTGGNNAHPALHALSDADWPALHDSNV